LIREEYQGETTSVLYDPWPFGDPPIVEYRRTKLAMNILICALLLPVFAISVEYLVRITAHRIRFTMRSLVLAFVATTCALSIFPYKFVYFTLYVTPIYVTNFAVGLCVVAAFHCLVRRFREGGFLAD
jgi:hypothetical protein